MGLHRPVRRNDKARAAEVAELRELYAELGPAGLASLLMIEWGPIIEGTEVPMELVEAIEAICPANSVV